MKEREAAEKDEFNVTLSALGISRDGVSGKSETSFEESSSIFNTESAIVGEHTTDNIATEKKPLVKFGVVALALIPIGLLISLLFWGFGVSQQSKKEDTLKDPQTKTTVSTDEKDRKNAELKAQLAIYQQKARAAQIVADNARKPTAEAPVETGETKPKADFPAKPGSVAATPKATTATTTDRATAQQTAQLNSILAQKNKATTELNSINRANAQAKQQSIDNQRTIAQEMSALSRTRSANYTEAQKLAKLQNNTSRLPQTIANRPQPIKVQPTKVQPQIVNNRQVQLQPQPKDLGWEEVAQMSMYGGRDTTDLAGAGSGSGSQLNPQVASSLPNLNKGAAKLSVGSKATGRIVAPFYALVNDGVTNSQNGKSQILVVLDRAIEVSNGRSLPSGTTISFDVAISDNGIVKATSKDVTVRGNRMNIAEGVFMVTGNGDRPLSAKVDTLNKDALNSANFNAALFGTLGEVGNVLINGSNSTSVTIGNGATIAQSTSNPNILGALFKGVSGYAIESNANRAKAIADAIERQSKLATIAANTPVTIYVIEAASFDPPFN
jgi:hypothetical protein